MHAARGFSLIELIMIIVAIGVLGAFLATVFTQLPKTLEVSESAQTGSQLAQQCSERVLARRRNTTIGFAPIASGVCAGMPVVAGYAVADVVSAYAGAACPGTATCKQVVVTVTRNSVIVSQTDFMLVN